MKDIKTKESIIFIFSFYKFITVVITFLVILYYVRKLIYCIIYYDRYESDYVSTYYPGCNEIQKFNRKYPNSFAIEPISKLWKCKRPSGPGLHNLGNTGFANSALQILSYTPILYEYFFYIVEKCLKDHKSIFCAKCQLLYLFIIMKNCYNDAQICIPEMICQHLKFVISAYIPGSACDADEFLSNYINALNDQALKVLSNPLTNKYEYSVFDIMFYGTMRHTNKCNLCKYQSSYDTKFLEIALPIKNCNSLTDAIREYFKPRYCEKTFTACQICQSKKDIIITTSILTLPRVLIFQLMKFEYIDNEPIKIKNKISFKKKLLNMENYIYECDEDVFYSLYGIIVHEGEQTNMGHYFAYAINSDRIWCKLDDDRVYEVDYSEIFSCDPYLLFYIMYDGHV